MTSIDLNSDLGESFGSYTMGQDQKIIPLVSSVNVACGMHAGDPCVMQKTIQLAAQLGIAIGAHPGYPDLQGFGRRDLNLSATEAYSFVLYQIGALAAFCRAEGTFLSHVKPHGQLYNRAAVDIDLARAIVQAIYDFDETLVVVGLANSKLIQAADEIGLTSAQEFFVDRNYTDEGTLVPRLHDNAIICDEDFAASRLVDVIKTGKIKSINGCDIQITADTVCVHGDNNQALKFVQKIHETLKQENIDIKPVQH